MVVHEIGLVDDIISGINAKLKESKENSKVKKVNIIIGKLEHIANEHFEFHFRERTKDTQLENAELSFKQVEPRFRCKDCKNEFSLEEGMEGCPKCKSKLNDIIAGKGISVESIEIV